MPPQVAADPVEKKEEVGLRRNVSQINVKSGEMAPTPVHKRSNSLDSKIRKLFMAALRKGGTKCLFKTKFNRPKTPVDLVRQTTFLLSYLNSSPITSGPKYNDKIEELDYLLREMKIILYGTGESEPSAEACAQLTQQFFKENTLRNLIIFLPKLDLEGRKDATQVVANLQRQPVNSRLIASDHLESNLDLVDILLTGYEDPVMALHYGVMLRECIRHQTVAKYILKSEHVGKYFDFIQLPNFDVAADAATTFKELMTRHKSTVAEFLSQKYDWFFAEFNSKLLESTNYITRRQAVKLLGEILLDRSNAGVMVRYVSSKDNLRILMNLLRESSKNIQLDAFHVFKIFVANENKPPDVVNILVANRSKILRLFSGLTGNKDDEAFEADKAWVVGEISALEATGSVVCSGELMKPQHLRSDSLVSENDL